MKRSKVKVTKLCISLTQQLAPSTLLNSFTRTISNVVRTQSWTARWCEWPGNHCTTFEHGTTTGSSVLLLYPLLTQTASSSSLYYVIRSSIRLANSHGPALVLTVPYLHLATSEMWCWSSLEEGEYRENCLCLAVLCTIIMVHKDMSSSYRSVNCIGVWSCLV